MKDKTHKAQNYRLLQIGGCCDNCRHCGRDRAFQMAPRCQIMKPDQPFSPRGRCDAWELERRKGETR